MKLSTFNLNTSYYFDIEIKWTIVFPKPTYIVYTISSSRTWPKYNEGFMIIMVDLNGAKYICYCTLANFLKLE